MATEETLATEALALKVQLEVLNKSLEDKKEELRQLANGEALEIEIKGQGVVRVTKPRAASQETIIVINEDKLDKAQDLREKLLQKGVLERKIKKSPPAKASVVIEPNV